MDRFRPVGAGFAYTGDLKGLFVNLAAFSNHVVAAGAWPGAWAWVIGAS